MACGTSTRCGGAEGSVAALAGGGSLSVLNNNKSAGLVEFRVLMGI